MHDGNVNFPPATPPVVSNTGTYRSTLVLFRKYNLQFKLNYPVFFITLVFTETKIYRIKVAWSCKVFRNHFAGFFINSTTHSMLIPAGYLLSYASKITHLIIADAGVIKVTQWCRTAADLHLPVNFSHNLWLIPHLLMSCAFKHPSFRWRDGAVHIFDQIPLNMNRDDRLSERGSFVSSVQTWSKW